MSKNYHEIIPIFNNTGRLCNFTALGDGKRVKVPPDEWERFNELAGRQHEIINGVVVFNENLEPTEPDNILQPPPSPEELYAQIEDLNEVVDSLVIANLGGMISIPPLRISRLYADGKITDERIDAAIEVGIISKQNADKIKRV